jgi:hypothetical protein
VRLDAGAGLEDVVVADGKVGVLGGTCRRPKIDEPGVGGGLLECARVVDYGTEITCGSRRGERVPRVARPPAPVVDESRGGRGDGGARRASCGDVGEAREALDRALWDGGGRGGGDDTGGVLEIRAADGSGGREVLACFAWGEGFRADGAVRTEHADAAALGGRA